MADCLEKGFFIALSGVAIPIPLIVYGLYLSVKRNRPSFWGLAAGQMVLQLVLWGLLAVGTAPVLKSAALQAVFGLLGAALLCYLALPMLQEGVKNRLLSEITDKPVFFNDFVLGAALCAANTGFLGFWSVSGNALLLYSVQTGKVPGAVLFLFGYTLATFLLYSLFSLLIRTVLRYIPPRIQRILVFAESGGLFILALSALFSAVKLIFI